MRTGLLFGSFNPLHKGHIAIAKAMLKKAKLDEVWLVISPHNPHKEKKGLLPDKLRLDILRAGVKNCAGIKACDTEYKLPGPSYTYRTLRAFRKTFPKREFFLIMGSDNLEKFETWKNYKEILRHHRLLVYPRTKKFSNKFPDQVTIIKAPLMNISSTRIREALRRNKNVKPQLPAGVHKYLKKIKGNL